MINSIIRFGLQKMQANYNTLVEVIFLNSGVAIFLFIIGVVFRLFGYDYVYNWLEDLLCMSSAWEGFLNKPWSLLTHLLVQKGLYPVIWSSLMLYLFGTLVYDIIGKRHFLPIYILAGISGGCMVLFFYNIFPRFKGVNIPLYGIGSCIYGLIAALSTVSPNYKLSLFLIWGIRLKYLIMIFLFFSLYDLDSGIASGISQIGGALAGFLYAKCLSRTNISYK